MSRSRGRGRWRGGSTQGRGGGRGRGKSQAEESDRKSSDVEQSRQVQEERVNPPENGGGSALKKKKGKRRTATSLIVIELDDVTAEYLLKESNFHVIQNLYEMTTHAKSLLFLHTKSDVIEKLKTKFDRTMEAKVLEETFTKEERKSINSLRNINMGFQEKIMEIVVDHADKRIEPETSVYVGSLFTKKDMLHENLFRFGTVCSTLDELFTLSDAAPAASNEEENNSHLIHTLTSPTKQLDMEMETEQPEQVLQETIQLEEEDVPSSATNPPQTKNELYFSRLRELSAKISSKLAHKFEEIKPKMLTFDLKNTKIPNIQSSENHLLSKEERQMLEHKDTNLEEIISAQLKKESINKDEKPFIISVSELKKEVTVPQIRDLKFEVVNEMDSQPILNKLQASKRSQEK